MTQDVTPLKDQLGVTPREQTDLALPVGDDLDPLGSVGQEELVLPTVKLVQAVSRAADATKAGSFFDPLTGAYRELLNVAILRLGRSRSLFAEGSFDQPPLCSSDDAVKPQERVMVGNVETGPTCDECPFSMWGSAKGGKGKGQACGFSYNLLCMDLEIEEPYILRVGGTSIIEWRRYMTAAKRGRLPIYAIKTTITSEARTFEAGKAYVTLFANGGPLAHDVALSMRSQAAAFKGASLDAAEAEEIPAYDEPDDVPFE